MTARPATISDAPVGGDARGNDAMRTWLLVAAPGAVLTRALLVCVVLAAPLVAHGVIIPVWVRGGAVVLLGINLIAALRLARLPRHLGAGVATVVTDAIAAGVLVGA